MFFEGLSNQQKDLTVDASTYGHIHGILRGIAQGAGLRYHDAEDIASDAVIVLLKAGTKGIEIRNLLAWLRSTTRYLAINAAKRASRETPVSDAKLKSLDEGSGEVESPDIQAIDAESKALLHEAIEYLPARQQEVFKLLLSGLKSVEIAEQLGFTESYISRTKRFGLSALRKRLKQRGVFDDDE